MLLRLSFLTLVAFASTLFPFGSQLKAQVQRQGKTSPATQEEIQTYMLISTGVFCRARALDIDFDKSLVVALSSQAEVIFGKHGGVVPGNPKPLERKQFLNSAPVMILASAMNFCPNTIPDEQKKELKADLKKLKEFQEAAGK